MAPTVSLVAMPWALADRPSIQLAALKAYLQHHAPGTVQVRAHHPYLNLAADLGFSLYQSIAAKSWIGEALYAPLLFPDRRAAAAKLVNRHWRSPPVFPFARVEQALTDRRRLDPLLDSLAGSALVGFTVCFAQLTASLYLAAELKRRNPRVPVVFGGSMVCEAMGQSLLSAFPQVDFVVNGEGEQPLAALIDRLLDSRPVAETPIPGLFYRTPAGTVAGGGRQQLDRLDSLPIPDYQDFFNDLKACPPLAHGIVQLLVEGSRGCWWHRTAGNGRQRACRFCNLNLQWNGYRAKEPERLAGEIAELSRRHRSPKVALVDNTLPPGNGDRLFAEIEKIGRTLHLFAELRVPVSEGQMRGMRRAGVEQVQVGIEALGSRLLNRMGKGTRAIDNIAAMKWCEQFGIENQSNLLLGFPGSDEQDVAETLRVLDYVSIYRPLRPVRFWLGEGSPIHADPNRFGLRAVRNHRWYRSLFPAAVADQLTLMVKDYRGDQGRQRRLWQPVKRRLEQWRADYLAVTRTHPLKPVLGYSDGGDFLVVHRRTSAADQQQAFRLAGRSRAIYLECREPKKISELQARFCPVSATQLMEFLDDLCNKRILIKEHDRVLSLAVDEDIRRFCRGLNPNR